MFLVSLLLATAVQAQQEDDLAQHPGPAPECPEGFLPILTNCRLVGDCPFDETTTLDPGNGVTTTQGPDGCDANRECYTLRAGNDDKDRGQVCFSRDAYHLHVNIDAVDGYLIQEAHLNLDKDATDTTYTQQIQRRGERTISYYTDGRPPNGHLGSKPHTKATPGAEAEDLSPGVPSHQFSVPLSFGYYADFPNPRFGIIVHATIEAVGGGDGDTAYAGCQKVEGSERAWYWKCDYQVRDYCAPQP